jgi:hypothetical protein
MALKGVRFDILVKGNPETEPPHQQFLQPVEDKGNTVTVHTIKVHKTSKGTYPLSLTPST